jgi:response regulator of citrate/malate metabolism
MEVEGVRAELVDDVQGFPRCGMGGHSRNVDEGAAFLKTFEPDILIDATMMKKAKGLLLREYAPSWPPGHGVGPGFRAPDQVDAR